MPLLEHWPHCHQELKLFLSSPWTCECPWGKVSAQGLAHGLCLRDIIVLTSSPPQSEPSLHSVCVLVTFGKTLTLASTVARPPRVDMIPDPALCLWPSMSPPQGDQEVQVSGHVIYVTLEKSLPLAKPQRSFLFHRGWQGIWPKRHFLPFSPPCPSFQFFPRLGTTCAIIYVIFFFFKWTLF